MAVIDVGPGATDLDTSATADYTLMSKVNPANDSGKLTSFELWFVTNATGVKVGTFYGTSPDYTSRDSETIGNVTSGSKQTFSGLDCDVETDDLAGLYDGTGTPEYGSAEGGGVAYKAGDQFGAGQQTYTVVDTTELSIYATGTTIVAVPRSYGFIIG